MSDIKWLSEITEADQALVGAKATHLAKLKQAGLSVPDGFVITTRVSRALIEQAGIKSPLRQLSTLKPTDFQPVKRLTKSIRQAISVTRLPKATERAIHEATLILKKRTNHEQFVIRSSLTAEYRQGLNFSGHQQPIFGVTTITELTEAIRRLINDLYRPETVYYSAIHSIGIDTLSVAVIVQDLVEAEVSGVLMTIDPIGPTNDQMVVEAGRGLGLATSSGEITPDRYLMHRLTGQIIDRQIANQKWLIVTSRTGLKHRPVPKDRQNDQKVPDETLYDLARFGRQAEQIFGYPQDLEWALAEGQLWFVHARPILLDRASVDAAVTTRPRSEQLKAIGQVMLRGIPASVGIASGPIKVLSSPNEIEQFPDRGILVTEIITPAYGPIIQKAAAVITDSGGMTTHAAIITREFGVPCVVGTGEASRVLTNGQIITVDGFHGVIYQGLVHPSTLHDVHRVASTSPGQIGRYLYRPDVITGTKIYVNLTNPNQAKPVAHLPVDGVGLVRAEFLVASLGEHPKSLLAKGQSALIVDQLMAGLETIARAFAPRPVIYRVTDFKSNEYRQLAGGQDHEPTEQNPSIGWRGARRHLDDPELLKIELSTLKRLREEQNLTNLWLIYPFVRTIDELQALLSLTSESGLAAGRDFKIWLMVETPANVLLIDQLCQQSIQGVSIGSNDLTQLILGVDRDNSRLANIFDERDPAVMSAMKRVVEIARRYHLTSSICGNGPSVHPEVVAELVEAGITSISVVPDVVEQTRRLVASVERRMLVEKALA